MAPTSSIGNLRARLAELVQSDTRGYTVEFLDPEERVVSVAPLGDLLAIVDGLQQQVWYVTTARDNIAVQRDEALERLKRREAIPTDRERLTRLLDMIVAFAGDSISENGSVNDDLAVAWLRRVLTTTGATTNDNDPPVSLPTDPDR